MFYKVFLLFLALFFFSPVLANHSIKTSAIDVYPARLIKNYGNKIWCTAEEENAGGACSVNNETVWEVSNFEYADRIKKLIISADDVNDNLRVYKDGVQIGNFACSIKDEVQNSYYQEFTLSGITSSTVIKVTASNDGCSDSEKGQGKAGAWVKNLKMEITYK